jgi:glycogen operon protein
MEIEHGNPVVASHRRFAAARCRAVASHRRFAAARDGVRGAVHDGRGTSFAVWSGAASSIELCLFDATGEERARIPLQRDVDGTWHGYIPDIEPGQRYGYRAHGPFAPERGQRFNPHKLLIDPCARALERAPRWHELHEGGASALDLRDSAGVVPRALVVDGAFDWSGDAPPRTDWRDMVIYECHVKGLTALHPDVAPELRGTFLGLSSEPVIAHLRALGVTAVELMPVHQAYSERFLVERGLSNYWGYNTIGFFAPDARFAAGGGATSVHEFKTMVRALHRAGIEVILDVVYNHTGEADELGPTLSLRGLDNAAYYMLEPRDPSRYANFCGCGNTLNLEHPAALRLVADSLRYWVQEMHVDGFRFDLAPALARKARGGIELDQGLLALIDQDPVLAGVKRIAEPWDATHDGMQLGRFMPGWAEWNSRYRDGVRRFFRGDARQLGEIATRLSGSSDLFAGARRGPHASVNFVACHDGFTLRDLLSYERKHNQQNGWDDRDGENDNASRNFGVEGPTERADVLEARARTARSLLATVACSLGVPMLQQGDEMGRTQHGNNNPYGHDSEIGWVDWRLDAEQRELLRFARRCFELRRTLAVFRRREHFGGAKVGGRPGDAAAIKDVSWLRAEGGELRDDDWNDPERRALAMWVCGHDADGRPNASLPSALLLLNGGDQPVSFRLPDAGAARSWRVLLESAASTCAPSRAGGSVTGASFVAPAHAVCLLQAAAAHGALERA